MDIFCEKCQKMVGQVADDKIPAGKKVNVSCPKCGEKIHFSRPGDASSTSTSAAPAVATRKSSSQKTNTGSAAGILDYDFSIMDIVRESWQKTSGVKGSLWGSFAVVFLAAMIVSMVVAMLANLLGPNSASAALAMALQFTITLAMYPFMAGVMMMGIRRSVDQPVSYKMAFGYFGFLLPILPELMSVVNSALVMIHSSISILFLKAK